MWSSPSCLVSSFQECPTQRCFDHSARTRRNSHRLVIVWSSFSYRSVSLLELSRRIWAISWSQAAPLIAPLSSDCMFGHVHMTQGCGRALGRRRCGASCFAQKRLQMFDKRRNSGDSDAAVKHTLSFFHTFVFWEFCHCGNTIKITPWSPFRFCEFSSTFSGWCHPSHRL